VQEDLLTDQPTKQPTNQQFDSRTTLSNFIWQGYNLNTDTYLSDSSLISQTCDALHRYLCPLHSPSQSFKHGTIVIIDENNKHTVGIVCHPKLLEWFTDLKQKHTYEHCNSHINDSLWYCTTINLPTLNIYK